MLKAILLLLSFTVFADDKYATISVQRWQKKIVVTLNHDKGWHTYWKNPGDAGIASVFKFSKETKAYEWPVPKKYLEAGDILTIGYGDVQHFFFEDISGAFDLKVNILICKDICIPGEEKLNLGPNDQFVSSRLVKPYESTSLQKAFDSLPQEGKIPQGFEYYLTREKDKPNLTLHYSIKNFKNTQLPEQLNLLTPFPQAPWGFKRESLFFKDGTLYGKTEIEWDGEYSEPPLPLPATGKFEKPYELKFLLNFTDEPKVRVITLRAENFSTATATLNDFYKGLPPFDGKSSISGNIKSDTESIVHYFFLAFLGGLILNLMPCVLPVISLKLFGLIKHKNLPKKEILSHNIAYTAGILSTFMVLGGVIAGIKAGGEEIGWGFQLQSPTFVLIMMIVLFILSLNLFGLFEFATPGGAKLGSTEIKKGFSGDFFSGVLTTVLSTPCSAPFLGTALTFGFTTTNANIFIMFFFIGIGLAFPFLLTAVFPRTLHFFPKPGMWMEKMKYFLGLSLLVTMVWLYDVFVSLVDFDLISWRLNLLLTAWFFAFFFAKKISRQRISQFLFFIIPIVMTALAIQNLKLKSVSTFDIKNSQGLWKPWSESALEKEKGKFVFMDFTAEWCLTCKVNKKLVLETQGFNDLSEKYNVLLLRADWTKRDDNITQYLRKFNVVGVPAYFIQKPNGEVVSLGETISVGKIEKYLKESP